ncbi:hypothetical protein [Paenibacillus sp. NEAU-GSW1]|uniref:hypothetical protein n=1 Tax=Paenibacillus sp. NEAU-GSW1 TaxID=2682486 RepID=UPI001C12C54F|nr:hypothetical protein [Paenibacillus sp. NEAU-GSW1]
MRLNQSFYKYVVFILFVFFTLLVVHLSNEALIRNGDASATIKFLFVQYGVLFAFGASLHMLTASGFRLRLKETGWTLALSLVLVAGCYLLAVFTTALRTEATGFLNAFMRLALDDRSQLVVVVLAGYLFGRSFTAKRSIV